MSCGCSDYGMVQETPVMQSTALEGMGSSFGTLAVIVGVLVVAGVFMSAPRRSYRR
jgi:hypothetical protein